MGNGLTTYELGVAIFSGIGVIAFAAAFGYCAHFAIFAFLRAVAGPSAKEIYQRSIRRVGCSEGVHSRAVIGGGAHFGDDLVTCLDCGAEWYDSSSLYHIAKEIRPRSKGEDGRYIPVEKEQWDV